jgi:hypothetical protein
MIYRARDNSRAQKMYHVVYITKEHPFAYESGILDCIFARLDVSREAAKRRPDRNDKEGTKI